jgi:hypothetical protein
MTRFSIIAALVSVSVSCVGAIPQGTGGGGGGFVPLIDKRYTWDNLVSQHVILPSPRTNLSFPTNSLIRSTQIEVSFEESRSATTSATRPRRVLPRYARPPFSTLSMVRAVDVCQGSTPHVETSSLSDFCFWAPPNPGHEVGEIEGEMVAWCTQPGHGTRVIPDGAITGVQFTKAPDYIQVVGFMNQTQINMLRGDAGGEMDPHGADRVCCSLFLKSHC